GEVVGCLAGLAVVAGDQAGGGGQGPDRGAVGVRRGEQLLRGGAAHHVEQVAGGTQVEDVAAQERRDRVAVLAAPVEGGLRARGRLACQGDVREGRGQLGEDGGGQCAAHPVGQRDGPGGEHHA